MALWVGEVVTNFPTGPGIYRLRLKAPIEETKPGQFVHLRCGSGYDPLLRRPLSIHDFDPGKQEIEFLYRVVGKGTAWLAARVPGERISGLGPLGRGFVVPFGKRLALVAGGMGLAPLFFLAREAVAQGNRVTFYQGARSRNYLLRERELAELGVELEIATEDGSAGFTGLVTDLLADQITSQQFDGIFACGPRDMLAVVASLAATHLIPAQVSLEEHMACGLGACRGCAVPIYQEDGNLTYENVCSEGPVFPAHRVAWDVFGR
ncbi:dihydroorotate oxidase B, electron transfer subunit [Thermanaeromonas toyohensis ToBE]|uniref:Dihydroorotate dehydrogenase B (NAD(+)), electron transfer subunit n=1 Tax=Thermanaeromonas toyohensis ToBE TaxID=698762 RepID=A0A1W1W3G9_9FIRM|nr:dihydroorotate dehydrogenase electron transfer subunit [Thermanaeromonas toyohensis]SMB99921.1 dihydroorotate oxidase B, electron transfer subunit [Thermanaeromonas toyohensis ToBE]